MKNLFTFFFSKKQKEKSDCTPMRVRKINFENTHVPIIREPINQLR